MAESSDIYVRWRKNADVWDGEYSLSGRYPVWGPFCSIIKSESIYYPAMLHTEINESPGHRKLGDAKRWCVTHLEDFLRARAMQRNRFSVKWSEEDREYVGLCRGYKSLSYLDEDRDKALQGIKSLVFEHEEEQALGST